MPAWLFSLGLQLYAGLSSGSTVLPFMVSSATRDGYPRIDRVWKGLPAVHAALSAGDRIVQVGDRDLRGASKTAFQSRAHALAPRGGSIPLVVERSGVRLPVTIALQPWPPRFWTPLPYAIAVVAAALLVLVRAPSWHLRRPFFVACLASAIDVAFYPTLGGVATYAWAWSRVLALPLALAIGLRMAFEWCEAGRPARSWQTALAAAFGLSLAGVNLWMGFLPAPAGVVLTDMADTVLGAFLLTLPVAIAWSARLATPLERRQGKWIFFGLYVGCLPLALGLFAGFAGLPLAWELDLLLLGRLALVAIPLGFLISIVAYHWLDIDRLIGASATYTLLGVGLLGGAFVIVPRIAASAGDLVGLDRDTSQLVLSMLLAAVAVPLYRAARPWVDRLLLAERFAVDRGFEALLRELPGARDAAELVQLAGEAVTTLLRPESCVIYSRSRDAFEPVFARGTAVPPAFESGSPLIGALTARSTPLVARRFAQRSLREKLSPFDRAALETLATAAVVPVQRRGELVAFLALGPKRSGDIYSPGDVTLLSAVSGAVSNRLERFDDAEVAREARAMQEELRRFVPGAVARVIESAESLEPREEAVSVLFVDIRGYAAYAESRAAHEIFSAVNRYTSTVSAIVEKHGGAVVEFNGDGMMAVFGAPRRLPAKERAAVSAGREIVEALERGAGAGPPISVGVGIATGSAYVGAVQAVDRRIWTALGNTTNLAARLQVLTRELEAAIVIDAATQRSAGDAAVGFQPRPQVQIRGRSRREDLYLLPITQGTSK